MRDHIMFMIGLVLTFVGGALFGSALTSDVADYGFMLLVLSLLVVIVVMLVLLADMGKEGDI